MAAAVVRVGIGSCHRDKDWPDAYWAELIAGLRGRTAGTLFQISGAQHAGRARQLIAGGDGSGAPAVDACDLGLIKSVALLRHADLFVGTDSGPMNLAAAADAFTLFARRCRAFEVH
jgi:heptosyltransferase-2